MLSVADGAAAGRRADREPRLLARPELRPLRLQLEYLGAELGRASRTIASDTAVLEGSAYSTRLAGAGLVDLLA